MVRPFMNSVVKCAAMLVLFCVSMAEAQVTARVDRTRLVEGETLTLVLQTDDRQQSLETDLSVLETQFMVLDQRSETQMSIVNGQQSAVIRKMVTLEPLRPGRLVIPELDMGGIKTRPIVVEVEPAPAIAAGDQEPVFIEVSLYPQDGPYYVHAQVGLIVRLYYQQSLTEAAISQPEPENASVRLLDEVPFQAERGGQRYRVLERRYAVFPERSGPLTIPPLVLSGRLVQRSPDRLWTPSSRGRRITVQSEPVSIEVLPKPDNFSGEAWQPARSYRLGEQLSTTGAVNVGEPVTRTITIDAVGLEENMIAEPDWPAIPDARVYPDQPQGISRDDGEWVLGHKEFRYAVVPEKEGQLVLPALRIAWWDTVANEQRFSELAARTISVLPSEIAQQAAPGSAATLPATNRNQPSAGQEAVMTTPGYWRWLALVFAVLWLATLAWIVWGRSAVPRVTAAGAGGRDETALESGFRRACQAGDAPAARQALRSWLRRHAPVSRRARLSLVDFARECGNETLGMAVRQLDGAGFSQEGDQGWDGPALYRAWREWRAALERSTEKEASVIDLYAKKRASG